MAFTSKDVMDLRQRTGVGMMDCKKALVATDGDMEAAIDYLRERGMAQAAKKESRIAAEGIVYAAGKNGKYVLLEVNCESDFVAGGPVFKEYVAQIANYILDNTTASVEDVTAAMQTVTNEYVMKMGEKLSIRRFTVYTANDSAVDTYIHMGGKIGVLLEVNCETDFVAKTDEFKALVKDIAMQIAAANPKYLRKEDVDTAELDKEKEILRAQALNEGKPEKIVDKMVEGRIQKYFKEVCLLEQPFVKDPDKSVQDLVTEKIAKIGENISVRRFVRYEMGEGLEKRQDNFVEEVMAQTGNK